MASYLEEQFGRAFMDEMVDWVRFNLGINDLFDTREIENWLEDNAQDYGYFRQEEQ